MVQWTTGVSSMFPWKSKDQTLPISSRENFTLMIIKTILCLVLDFQWLPFKYSHFPLNHDYGRNSRYYDWMPAAGNLRIKTPSWERSPRKLSSSYSTFILQKIPIGASAFCKQTISTNKRTFWNLWGNCQFLCVNFKDVWCCRFPAKVGKLWTFCDEHIYLFQAGLKARDLCHLVKLQLCLGEKQAF